MKSSLRRKFAFAVKIVLLALITAILMYMSYIAFLGGESLVGFVLAGMSLTAILVYSSKKFIAGKFFYPGLVFLLIFVVSPVIYTVVMSAYNYKDGNIITKEAALHQLVNVTGNIPVEGGNTYEYISGTCDGTLGMLLTDMVNARTLLACRDAVIELDPDSYQIDEFGKSISAKGFTPFQDDEAFAHDEELASKVFKVSGNKYIKADGAGMAFDSIQTITYDAKTDTLQDTVAGLTYINNGNGNFVNPDNPDDKLYPGWRQFNPLQNYAKIATDPVLRDPFIRVFIWTVFFAGFTVIVMGAFGLVLAVALDKKIRFRGVYRALLILPYAMPSFMSILIWAGMFNRDYGAINTLFGTHIDFLGTPWTARAMILIVNLWLGFPYFYMISTGALQALPTDLEEAAALDGANERQIFTRIKMPLVLQILYPLLIASFAFNFNNFNLIYLLTKGGPTNVLDGETAGATDILITYAYKTAFAGTEQNLGLASAISVVVFIIVAFVSLWSLKKSKVLEEVR